MEVVVAVVLLLQTPEQAELDQRQEAGAEAAVGESRLLETQELEELVLEDKL
jgi:hypothetical protein